MSKHTPGPWDVYKHPDGGWCVAVGGLQDDFYLAHTTCYGFNADANARLIAAAPELLEALQAAIECGMIPSSSAKEGGAVRFSRQVHVADQIRAAIAKATGGDV